MKKRILITGATGFIGSRLLEDLAGEGKQITALYRNEKKVPEAYPDNVRYVKGDILDNEKIRQILADCDQIYHLAAYAKQYARDKTTYIRVNFDATLELLKNALSSGIEKVVICSTAGVFGPSEDGKAVDEKTVRKIPYFSDYEKYKDIADHKIFTNYANKLDVTIVCPTRVFGPGILSESNSVTRLIREYLNGKFRFLPGKGNSLGNYVFVDDVVRGLKLAMKNGISGERYILGGENVSYYDLFECVAEVSNRYYKMYMVPPGLILAGSAVMLAFAKITHTSPKLTPDWARKYLYEWKVSSEKAKSKLGYSPHSLRYGVEKTIEWLNRREISNE